MHAPSSKQVQRKDDIFYKPYAWQNKCTECFSWVPYSEKEKNGSPQDPTLEQYYNHSDTKPPALEHHKVKDPN